MTINPDCLILVPPRRLANNGSLASPHIRAYHNALLLDLAANCPDIDGIRVDWPEYPPYFLDDVFLDFCPHAEAAAKRLHFDFQAMRSAAGDLYRLMLGGLKNEHLTAWTGCDRGRHKLIRTLANNSALLDWVWFKANLVDELLLE